MRTERDSMGEMSIPDDALWGAQTQRAMLNFDISGLRWNRRLIEALIWIKKACARANLDLGLLPASLAQAILQACDEMLAGRWADQFPLDVFQTGSGTSTNMNVNEVLANRAAQILGGAVGSRMVHPNDHVNLGQSSNDVIPTAIYVAAWRTLHQALIPALEQMGDVLAQKAQAFDHIVKSGRTHLQDATPIRLGQEFDGYAAQARYSAARARRAADVLRELPLGGTAVGSGINCPAGMPRRAIGYLNDWLAGDWIEAGNHMEANAARDACVEASGQLKTIAVSLTKIANDVRWLGSGPRNGLGELILPEVQPGSSIMPGKVNPVMAEALIMACAQVIGNDAAITLGGLGSVFELNLMMPLVAHNLLQSIELLSRAALAFTERCLVGLQADEARCQAGVEGNLTLATALLPYVGYDRAAQIAQEAHRSGRTVRQVAQEWQVMTDEQLEQALDARKMTG